jgi:Arc/MetJ-type ribon-helix-helix transcriptional regulator
VAHVVVSDETKATLDALVNDGTFASDSEAVDAVVQYFATQHAAWWAQAAPAVERGRRDIAEGRFKELREEDIPDIVAEMRERWVQRQAEESQ